MLASNGNSRLGALALDDGLAALAMVGTSMAINEPESRLDEIMSARGMSNAELCRLTGMQPPTLSKLRKGQRGITPNHREALAVALRVPAGSLYEAIGAPVPSPLVGFAPGSDVQPGEFSPVQPWRPPAEAVVPVMGTAQGGTDGFFEINLTHGPVEYIDRPPGLAGVAQGDLFAIRVHGESMAPVWDAGDPVFIVKSRPRKAGAYVVVLVDAGPGHQPRALLKKLLAEDNRRFRLAQYNPPAELEVERNKVKEIWRALHWRELVG